MLNVTLNVIQIENHQVLKYPPLYLDHLHTYSHTYHDRNMIENLTRMALMSGVLVLILNATHIEGHIK